MEIRMREIYSFHIVKGIMFLLFSCGCTYSIKGGGALVGKSIAIPTFETKSERFGIREEVTAGIISAFREDGRLRLVDEKKADLLLSGTLISYKREPYTYDRNEILLSYKVRLFVDLALKDMKDGKVLWEEKSFEGWATCGISPDSEDIGISLAVKKLGKDIVRRTLEEW